MPKVVITYGTFDLFHVGHLNLLRRARALGDRLIVGVSTDEFNALKGKRTIITFADRLEVVRSVRYVDEAISESCWEQKVSDILKYNVDTFVMGADWSGKFDFLSDLCKIVYLPRTKDISSTTLKVAISRLGKSYIQDLKRTLDIISSIVEPFQ